MKKIIALTWLISGFLFFSTNSNAQTITDNSCLVNFSISDPYYIPSLNMTYDFQVGERFFGHLSGLNCNELNKLKEEIYSTYLVSDSSNLYNKLNERINQTQNSLYHIEFAIDQEQRTISDEEWNVILSTFLTYMSGVELGYVIGTSGILTGGSAIGIIGVSAGLYLIYKGCTGQVDRLFAVRHMRKSVYLHQNLIEKGRSQLMTFHLKNYDDAIKTFNGLCNIVKNNCVSGATGAKPGQIQPPDSLTINQ